MTTAEISDSNGEILSFDLADILMILEPFARNLEWHVVELETSVLVGASDPQPSVKPWVIELLNQIRMNSTPTRILWDRLFDLSRNIIQTEMGLLLAIKPGNEPPRHPFDLNSERFEIVVQGVDNTFWAVTSHDDEIINQLKRRFKDVQVVAGTQIYY
jgi:hypothetical protein